MRASLAVISVLLSAMLALPLLAQDIVGQDYRTYSRFKPLPPRALLGKDRFAHYQSLLKAEDCAAAKDLLHRRFIARYPQFRDSYNEDGRITHLYLLWAELLVRKRYPELSICMAKKKLDAAMDQIAAERTKPGYFFHGDIGTEPAGWDPGTGWLARDLAISHYNFLANEDYGPAYVTLARLTRRGGVFRFGADVEYYFLRRACLLGVPCAPHEARLKALRASLGADAAMAMDRLAAGAESMVYELFKKHE